MKEWMLFKLSALCERAIGTMPQKIFTRLIRANFANLWIQPILSALVSIAINGGNMMTILLFLAVRAIKRIKIKNIIKYWGLAIAIPSVLRKEPSPSLCLVLSDDENIDEEEKSDHEGVSKAIAKFGTERMEVANQSARENMQSTGYAAMYEMQEYSPTDAEKRASEHSEEAAKIIIDHSPGGSPGTGSMKAAMSQIGAIKSDNIDAVNDDLTLIKEVITDGLKASIHKGIAGGSGTYMNYEDDQNDLE